MKKWTDLGNDQWRLTITSDTDPTAPASNFTGTRDEIYDKLADSQANANARINQLRKASNGGPSAPPTRPQPMTPEERLATVAEMQNPATVDKAVTRVMESVIGPVADFQKDRQTEREERNTRTAIQAAEMFFERTPQWYPSEHNKKTLVGYIQTQGLNPLQTQSYTQAFEELTAAQLLQAKPTEDETTTDEPANQGRNAPTPTPRPAPTRSSTSIRSSDISGTAPRPTTAVRLKYSREQLAKMSTSEYRRLMQTDRAELERCEMHYAKSVGRRAS